MFSIANDQVLTVDDLESIIKVNNISRSEQLTQYLPESYLLNNLLMFESRSSQQASPLKPRVILYGPTESNIFIGLSGFEGGMNKLNDAVEVISFDSNSLFNNVENWWTTNIMKKPSTTSASGNSCSKLFLK